jgi:hypothetical protein
MSTHRDHPTVRHKKRRRFCPICWNNRRKHGTMPWKPPRSPTLLKSCSRSCPIFQRNHERWGIKLEVLGEYTRHHVEEEEKGVFPEVLDGKKRNEPGEAFDGI